MKIDQYYTPAELARKMVCAIKKKQRGYIADFACGKGQLLSAARERWPKGKIIATDICRDTISALRRREPDWKIGLCDFLSASSRNRCMALNDLKGKVSLALLNPPFSNRGIPPVKTIHGKQIIHSSIALAFVLNAIQYLSKKGQIVTILPYGCLKNEKDNLAWLHLQREGRIDIIRSNGDRTFPGCSARTVIVKFTKGKIARGNSKKYGKYKRPIKIKINKKLFNMKINLIRGKIPMCSIDGNNVPMKSIPLIHSTELQDGKVIESKHLTDLSSNKICGPAILLPRVGKPQKRKLVLYNIKKPIVLSDCVMAIQFFNTRNAKKAYNLLMQYWSLVEEQYSGTCARHITLKGLSELLKTLGFQII